MIQEVTGSGSIQASYGFCINKGQFLLTASKGKDLCLHLAQVHSQAGLKEPLLLGQQLLLEQSQFKRLVGFAVGDDWRDMTQLLPIVEDRTHPSSSLVTQTNASESTDNSWITDLLFGRLQKLICCGKSIAWIPEDSAVPKELNDRFPSVITKILMDQEVDSCFAEGDVVRGVVVST